MGVHKCQQRVSTKGGIHNGYRPTSTPHPPPPARVGGGGGVGWGGVEWGVCVGGEAFVC